MEPTPGIKLIFLGKNKDLRTNHIVRLEWWKTESDPFLAV